MAQKSHQGIVKHDDPCSLVCPHVWITNGANGTLVPADLGGRRSTNWPSSLNLSPERIFQEGHGDGRHRDFRKIFFAFFRELKSHNDRTWFEADKSRFANPFSSR